MMERGGSAIQIEVISAVSRSPADPTISGSWTWSVQVNGPGEPTGAGAGGTPGIALCPRVLPPLRLPPTPPTHTRRMMGVRP